MFPCRMPVPSVHTAGRRRPQDGMSSAGTGSGWVHGPKVMFGSMGWSSVCARATAPAPSPAPSSPQRTTGTRSASVRARRSWHRRSLQPVSSDVDCLRTQINPSRAADQRPSESWGAPVVGDRALMVGLAQCGLRYPAQDLGTGSRRLQHGTPRRSYRTRPVSTRDSRLSFLERTRADVRAQKSGISLGPRQRIAAHAVTLVRATALVESLACVGTILAILAGIRIAWLTRVDPNSTSQYTATNYHPYVAAGVGIAVISLFLGMAVALLARTVRIYAEQSIARLEGPDSP